MRGTNGDDVDPPLEGTNNRDVVFGFDGNDNLYGGAGNDMIDAGAGDDTADGEAGDDTLFGGDGRDLVFGGDGIDSINGGTGSDRLFGGAGNDIFVFAVGNDTDTIYDFAPGEDRLEFQDLGDLEAVKAAAEQTSSGLQFNFGDGDSLLLIGVNEVADSDILIA